MDTFRSELQPWGVKVSLILPGYYKTGNGRVVPACCLPRGASPATSPGTAASLWPLGSARWEAG